MTELDLRVRALLAAEWARAKAPPTPEPMGFGLIAQSADGTRETTNSSDGWTDTLLRYPDGTVTYEAWERGPDGTWTKVIPAG